MQLNHDLLTDANVINTGTFLLLINVYHKPPHIAMSIDGKYYSLSVKGVEAGKPMSSIIRNLKIKRTPSLFIQLKPSANNLVHLFESYPALDTGIATCLSPVKDFCKTAYGIRTEKINYVFELLPILTNCQVVGKAFSLNLHPLDVQTFHLLNYTMDDINNSIRRNRMAITK